MNAPLPLLDVRGLEVRFRAAGVGLPFGGARYINALNGVSLSVAPGETLGIVGESGCGKSTLGRAILHLVEAQAGEVCFEDGLVSTRDRQAIARLRGQAAMIFQDPYGSLNPRIPIGEAIAEVLRVHGKAAGDAIPARVAELLRLVGLSIELADRRPHQLSGGQCQRVGIARALAIEPRLIIADECVAALDVSIQAQILNLLMELQRRMSLSLIFISHDLGVVRHLCRRVAVMYLGRIVEVGPPCRTSIPTVRWRRRNCAASPRARRTCPPAARSIRAVRTRRRSAPTAKRPDCGQSRWAMWLAISICHPTHNRERYHERKA
jgi:peptide/nickel transport system ATP-binding protein